MTAADLVTILPIIVLAATVIVIMVAIALYRNHHLATALTLAGFVLAFVMLPISTLTQSSQATPLLVMDGYALFYVGLILVGAFAVAVLSHGYLQKHLGHPEEFYLLLVLATLGAAVLVASNHFASFFLGLEILSVALYSLVAYLRRSERSAEAGFKYLILAASSAAFLLFGMALIYAESGTLTFARAAVAQAAGSNPYSVLLQSGLAMLVVGIGFKLAIVPFHLWTPDVYEGAPAPVTAFVATVSKGAMFALLLRYFVRSNLYAYSPLTLLFLGIAVASMLVGNLLALVQNNVKRILAYSSIAHLGYLLVALLASGDRAVTAVTFYLVSYFAATLSAFGVVSFLSNADRDADAMSDYEGLFWRHPWLAGILTTALLSLAGLPLTAGFIGKFYVLLAGVGSALWLLVIVLVVSSAIGLYYYLRITVAMFRQQPEEEQQVAGEPAFPRSGSAVLAVLLLVLLWLGVYPTPLVSAIQAIVIGLF